MKINSHLLNNYPNNKKMYSVDIRHSCVFFSTISVNSLERVENTIARKTSIYHYLDRNKSMTILMDSVNLYI